MNNLLFLLNDFISGLVNSDKPKQRYSHSHNMELKYHKEVGWQLTHNGIIIGRFRTALKACLYIQSLQAK
jgi:hypothetical protein